MVTVHRNKGINNDNARNKANKGLFETQVPFIGEKALKESRKALKLLEKAMKKR
ncbi:hypothetical protein PCCS19_50820 [Paenibacillus sp. CCS19]|uniref:hypothetical protein n=1 Tax=Paenibacillus sp. CCS19 TaxID=3158387 RepID=UPI00256B98A8|nr:hypothetical protein [Paenibacillus cellulosilyticus]GMK42023.1 hypothetical protein PCCS19_50820 [Paenibacillus cellulosilyticus]